MKQNPLKKKSLLSQTVMKNARTSGDYSKIWQNTGKCVFCDLRDKYILLEENGLALTINLYPYIDGQLIAIPRQHICSPKQLSQIQWNTIRKFAYLAKKIIRKTHGIKSMWTLMREGGVDAQMSVSDHLHIHFIPFDQANLCNWNYRKLQHTPLKNAQLYKDEFKFIKKRYQTFKQKYSHQNNLPVVCDLIIINGKKILFQQRTADTRFKNNFLSLPGGHVHPEDDSLEKALQREIKEEVNYEIDLEKKNSAQQKTITLIDSRITTLERMKVFKHLQKNINQIADKNDKNHALELSYSSRFLWNTYLLTNFDESQFHMIKAGDDCEKIVWVSLDEIAKHPRISDEVKEIFEKMAKLS